MALLGRPAATPFHTGPRNTAVLLLSTFSLLSGVAVLAAPPATVPAPVSRSAPSQDDFTTARPDLPPKEAVDREIRQVLSRKEFRKRGPSLMEQFREWLAKLLEKLGFHTPELRMGKGSLDVLQFVVLTLAISGFLFLIYYAVRYGTRRLKAEQIGPPSVIAGEGPDTPEAYLRQAEILAADGDYRNALEKAYVGTLLTLGNGKALEFRAHRTNWENLRTLHRAFPIEHARTLRRVSRLFDRKWYGLEQMSPDEYHRASSDLAQIRSGLDSMAAPVAATVRTAESAA